MKAHIKADGNQFVLTLEPEIEADSGPLRDFGMALGRTHIVNCRGFQYMNQKVEFLVQPYPSND